jgi:superfamily II DNA or RNA helicase
VEKVKQLRPYQTEAIERIRQALRGGSKRIVLQLPTGGGKSLIAAQIISMAIAKGKRVIFTCPRLQLIDQTARAFWDHGIREIGVMQSDHVMTDPSKPVQICSVQTLQRRTIPDADLVLIDECHMMSKFVVDWMGRMEWAGVPFIGLSATPWANGMARLYDELIISATTRQMIDEGYLSKFRVFAPSHPDLTGVKIVAGDYHEGQLSEAMQSGSLVGDIVSTWLARAEHRPTLVFAVDRAHAKAIQRAFEAAGVPCGYVDGNTPTDERETIKKAFHSGRYEVVSSIGVLTTGVDWDVRCIILARPTRSEMLYVQIVGRGLRTAEGKEDCLLFDHSDTTQRLGFVTDIHHDRLKNTRMDEAGKRERQPPKPKECSSCSFLKPIGVHKCPNCGFEPERQPTVETVPGELVELSSARKAKANREASWSEKEAFIADLKAYAIERGYKSGWWANQYRQKYGVWPNDPHVRYALPSSEVSMTTRAWIQSQNIRWAKRKERQA